MKKLFPGNRLPHTLILIAFISAGLFAGRMPETNEGGGTRPSPARNASSPKVLSRPSSPQRSVSNRLLLAQTTGAVLPELEYAVETQLLLTSVRGPASLQGVLDPLPGKVTLKGNAISAITPVRFGANEPPNPNLTGEVVYNYEVRVRFPAYPLIPPVVIQGRYSILSTGTGFNPSYLSVNEPATATIQPAGLGTIDLNTIVETGNRLSLQFTWKKGPNDCAFPALTQPLATVTACETGGATFSVAAQGNGALLYQWRKNGQPIEGATDATLSLNSVSPDDVGSYSVIVGDSCGAIVSNEVPLQLRDPSLCGGTTRVGSNVTVTRNGVQVTFQNVSTPGDTTITAIDPATAGTLPEHYVLLTGSLAFEIKTTAIFSGPITVTFNVPGVTDEAVFPTLHVLHGEGTPQAFVDRTVLAPDAPAPNFATKQISARVSSLSPFVIASLVPPPPPPPPTGCAVTNLQSPTNYATADTPSDIAHGDFNGDGKPDLVTANYEANAVSVLLNNGAGGFNAAVNYNAGSNPKAVAVGDLNGDGKLDLVVANLTSFDLSVFLGNGDGTFTTAPRVTGMSYPTSVAIGDFNNDGKADLVVANSGSFLTTVVYGNGDGTFAFGLEHFNFDGGMPYAVTAGDFNKDGKQDFAVAFNTKDAIGVYLNLPSGLTNNIQMFPAEDQPIAIAAGDFNGDGTDDVAAANYGSNTVTVVTGLSTVTTIAVGSLPETLAVADLNGDAKKDLIVGNAGTNFVSLLTATSGGQFTRQDVAGVESPSAVAATDFNGDGKVDVMVADYWVNRITTYQGACESVTSLEGPPKLQTLRYVRSKYDGYPNARSSNGRRSDTMRPRQR